MRLAKIAQKAIRRRAGNVRRSLAAVSPEWLRRRAGPIADHLELQLVDHGIFREVYLNRHRLSGEAWRAAQPAPRHIRQLARDGIRTIVNLRDERECGSYRLEREACARAGIALVNFGVKSRGAPAKDRIHGAKALFETVEYPILMHCKSGADRAGLMSVLYRVFRLGEPVEVALQQLDWRFGHFKQADTGVLDYFFAKYLEANASSPIGFLDWVDSVYEPDALKAEFQSEEVRQPAGELGAAAGIGTAAPRLPAAVEHQLFISVDANNGDGGRQLELKVRDRIPNCG